MAGGRHLPLAVHPRTDPAEQAAPAVGLLQFARAPSGSRQPSTSSSASRRGGGVALIALAVFSVASLLAPEGLLTRAWLGLLQTVFGWGLLAVPLALAAAGLWLVMRKFQARLPDIRPGQVVGSAMLYLGLLILLHAVLLPRGSSGSDAAGRPGARRRPVGRGDAQYAPRNPGGWPARLWFWRPGCWPG